jgi:MoaA/NifB/PqqE/SkfB family radical SAM enzyme
MLKRQIHRFRFSYARSFQRASPRQIWRFMDNLIRRPPSRHPRKFVSIALTHRCQYACDWCATGLFRKDRAQEFTTEEVERLLDGIRRSRHVFDNISFLGGECLLRPDVFHLVRAATRRGLFVHLSTNGLKLDAACVSRLRQAGLNSVFVALPVLSGNTEQEMRAHRHAVEGLCACARAGLPCFAGICVVREHVFSGDLERAVQLARECGAAGVRLMPVRLAGNWLRQATDRVLTTEEEWKVRSLCMDGFVFLSDDCCRELGRKCLTADRRIIYVSPYGDVQPCHFFPFSFGNVRTEPFDAILERMWTHALLASDDYTCYLQDEAFRARHIQPLDERARFPIPV